MVRQEVWMDVKLMHRQGCSVRHIARTTGLSRVSVRKILSSPTPKGYGPRPGKLDAFVPRLEALLTERPRTMAQHGSCHQTHGFSYYQPGSLQELPLSWLVQILFE